MPALYRGDDQDDPHTPRRQEPSRPLRRRGGTFFHCEGVLHGSPPVSPTLPTLRAEVGWKVWLALVREWERCRYRSSEKVAKLKLLTLLRDQGLTREWFQPPTTAVHRQTAARARNAAKLENRKCRQIIYESKAPAVMRQKRKLTRVARTSPGRSWFLGGLLTGW